MFAATSHLAPKLIARHASSASLSRRPRPRHHQARVGVVRNAEGDGASSSSSSSASASTPARRADDAPIASKPVATSTNVSNAASKALLNEVRAALVPSGADAATVLNATKRFVEAYEAGEEMDVVVARALGYKTIEDVPEAQRAYASKIADKLESNARTLRGEIEAATKKYESGVAAYGRGMYDDAVKWFSAAAEETSETSLLGGKIAIYKALALDAYGQRDKALDIYKYVESVHPEKSIRKQAEELRYILEAPRMELREDERVDVPILRDPDAFQPYNSKWSTAAKPSSGGPRRAKSLEEEYAGEAPEKFDYDKLRLGLQIVGGCVIAYGVAWYSTTLR